jgi:prohibitin 2
MISFLSFFALLVVIALIVKCHVISPKLKNVCPKSLASMLVVVCLIGILSPFKIIDAGHVGVVKSFGNVTKVVNSGIVFKIPFVQVIESITIQPIQMDQSIEVGSGGAITKDNQTVGGHMVFFYKYKEDQMENIYRNYGLKRIENIVKNAGIETFKQEIGTYAIFEIPTSQSKIQSNIVNNIRQKISEYPIEITDLKIVNYDWSDEFDVQIQKTMSRAQEVKQKEQELLIAEHESQKIVKVAQADKQAAITKAEGEKEAAILNAEAKAAEGEGIKKYNQSVQANMDLEIKIRQLEIERIKAEKWNGQYVPTNNYGPIPVQMGSIQR